MHTLSVEQPEELSDESRLDWQAAYQIFTAVMEEVDRGTRGAAHHNMLRDGLTMTNLDDLLQS